MWTTIRHFLPLWIKVRSLLISKGKKRGFAPLLLRHVHMHKRLRDVERRQIASVHAVVSLPVSVTLMVSRCCGQQAHIRRGSVVKHVPDVSRWRLKALLEENFPDGKITWLQSLNCDIYTFICTKRAICLGFNNIKCCSRGCGRASNRLAVALHVLITAGARWTVLVSDINVWGNGQL